MKNPFLVLFYLVWAFPFTPARAQVAQETTSADPQQDLLSALPSVTIRFKTAHDLIAAATTSIFSHFEVIDERPDTARIGVHTNMKTFRRPYDRQLIFDRSASSAVAAWLNNHFSRPGAPYTALIVLRALWLSDARYIREDLVRDPDRRFEKTHIRLKAEIYAIKGDRYLPLLRFDTLQATKKMTYYASLRAPYSDWGNNLASILAELADSSSSIMTRKQDGSRWISFEDIRQFNTSRFEAPIGKADVLTRGVYASFEEFRNNSPSVRDFEVKVEDNHRILYVREAGNTYYTHDAWGYCDGKDVYIMRDGILYSAWREGKAFYFYRDIISRVNPPDGEIIPTSEPVPPTGAVSGAPIATSANAEDSFTGRHADYKRRYVYSVDMDTGTVY
jgi:hypothetical protein